MSLLNLPEIRADLSLADLNFDLRPDVVADWEPDIQAAAVDPATSISIFGQIGPTFDGSGVTDRAIAAALRSIGSKDVTVNINSPGGNYFQGVAIYNMLLAHPAKVTVNVLGMAASAASVIAMAGDAILMGDGAQLMIHNAWGGVVGNRHDLAKAISQLAPLDADMAAAYSARSGLPVDRVSTLMDAETKFSASEAVGQGFATGHLQSKRIERSNKSPHTRKAMAMVETALASAGLSRSERRETLKSLFAGMPSAAEPAMPSAGDEVAALLRTTLNVLQGKTP